MSNIATVIQEAIIGGVVYDIFSNYVKATYDMANDFFSQDIKHKIKSLDSAKDLQEDELNSVAKAIEATIIETPQDIREIANNEEQKEAINNYFKKVIIDSFEDIEGSEISVKGDSKIVKDSFKNIKNSNIKI